MVNFGILKKKGKASVEELIQQIDVEAEVKKRFWRIPAILDDAIQAAQISLIDAAERYDPSKGKSWKNFAKDYIRWEAIKVYWDYMKGGLWQINKNRFKSFEDDEKGSKDEKKDQETLSYLPFNDFMCEAPENLSPEALVSKKNFMEKIYSIINSLPDNEKYVMLSYYNDEMTMKQIGEKIGLTESRVSQIHGKAIIRVREKLMKEQEKFEMNLSYALQGCFDKIDDESAFLDTIASSSKLWDVFFDSVGLHNTLKAIKNYLHLTASELRALFDSTRELNRKKIPADVLPNMFRESFLDEFSEATKVRKDTFTVTDPSPDAEKRVIVVNVTLIGIDEPPDYLYVNICKLHPFGRKEFNLPSESEMSEIKDRIRKEGYEVNVDPDQVVIREIADQS